MVLSLVSAPKQCPLFALHQPGPRALGPGPTCSQPMNSSYPISLEWPRQVREKFRVLKVRSSSCLPHCTLQRTQLWGSLGINYAVGTLFPFLQPIQDKIPSPSPTSETHCSLTLLKSQVLYFSLDFADLSYGEIAKLSSYAIFRCPKIEGANTFRYRNLNFS